MLLAHRSDWLLPLTVQTDCVALTVAGDWPPLTAKVALLDLVPYGEAVICRQSKCGADTMDAHAGLVDLRRDLHRHLLASLVRSAPGWRQRHVSSVFE